MKRLVALFLVLAMSLALVATCASAEEKPISIEIFYSPWGSITAPDLDPYEDYLEEKYGCDFVLSPTADFSSQVMVRFASDNPPDIVLATGNILNMLYEQGVVIDDWSPYVDQLQDTLACYSENTIKYFTRDGKLVAIPTTSEANYPFCFMIRKDWLKNLNMDMPTNMDELLEYLRACTFNDPDGNGQNDTYGLGVYGSGTSTGTLRRMLLFYDHMNFYIDDNGKVTHPVVTDQFLEYLKLAKTIVDEGILEPDWYAMGNQDFKISCYGGKYGLVPRQTYHTIVETDNARGNDGVSADMWEVMDLFQGKLMYGSLYSRARTVSKQCADDPAKMEIICKFLNDCSYPNDGFWKIAYGYGLDAMDVKIDNADGSTFLGYSSPEVAATRMKKDGTFYWGWMQSVFTAPDTYGYVYLTGAEPNDLQKYYMEQTAIAKAQPTYSNDYLLLNFDATLNEEVSNYLTEFEVNYLLGLYSEDDWATFKQGWLDIGGQTMLEVAEETFKSYGLIK